jgi:poly-gamma-glutamate synthesis protein (capsule biosynthesis protein)
VALHPTYLGFDGQLHTGCIEVHRDAVDDIEAFFGQALAMHFPFENVVPASAFKWDDNALMAANTTSGFNYRTIAGTAKISYHAVGAAIDVNTRLNPYCRYQDGTLLVEPPGASWQPEPERITSGILHSSHPLVVFMRSQGWEWGGDWDLEMRHVVDYQHFQKPALLSHTEVIR